MTDFSLNATTEQTSPVTDGNRPDVSSLLRSLLGLRVSDMSDSLASIGLPVDTHTHTHTHTQA